MITFHHVADLRKHAKKIRNTWEKSGFIPTMGALHEGHLSLIKAAQESSRITIASIFVNPSQFNDPEDFNKYPKTIAADIRMLEEARCDVLFLPDVTEMYPNGWQQTEPYDLGSLETLLEGFYRPGHFQGVCQIVHRLLDIVEPASIFMGQKDFQQCMVVQRLIELKKIPVQLHTCPTLREDDGLAMSSRNMRLSKEERSIAPAIYREMQMIIQDLNNMPLRALAVRAEKNLLDAGFTSVDYVTIATPATLQPLDIWEEGLPAVILIAAYIGQVRLIDNISM